MIVSETVPLNSARIVGFDIDRQLSAEECARLYLAGFAFGVRYLSLHAFGVNPLDLDAAEVGRMTDSGLALLTVQHARSSGWSEATGESDGAAAARNHLALGLPFDQTVSCDLEAEPSAPLSKQQALDYAGRWWQAAMREGCASLQLYVGAGVPLSPADLFHKLAFRLYWKSASEVPDVEERGYGMVQLSPYDQVVAGVGPLDIDVIGSDHQGGRVRWSKRAAAWPAP
jgi:hypothetical protein